MSMYNSARAAGFSDSYSRQACRIEKQVKASIIDELERAGITDKVQAESLAKLALDPDKKISLATWQHIAKLKKQVTDNVIDQSKHYSKVTYEFADKSSIPLDRGVAFDSPEELIKEGI